MAGKAVRSVMPRLALQQNSSSFRRAGRGAFVCFLGSIALLSGCSHSAHPLVAVIPETTAQELWESEHAGVAAAVLGTPWRVYWNGPTREDEIARQIELAQHANRMGVSGLILTPDHPLALTTLVRHILASGIPVAIVSTRLQMEPEQRLCFVLNDDDAAGRMAAARVGAVLHGHGQVALLGANPAISSSEARANSFARALAAQYPGITIVAQLPGSFSLGQTEQDAEQVFIEHPQLGALVTIGITETRGAAIALHSSEQRNKVALIGFDQDLDLNYALRQGQIDAIIAQDTFDMGEEAMQWIEAEHSKGAACGVKRIAPLLLTRETIDSPAVQRILMTSWRPQP